MQKYATAQDITAARRKNSMMLALLFAVITALMIFAFGYQILMVIVIFGIPVLMTRIWEEVNTHYVGQKPQNKAHTL